jgi:threonine dehydrogenase-like Zn-dependent dehydrogenase
MKQIIQDIQNKETRVIDVPVPKPGPGMALVKTAASVVSAGTERMQVEFAEKNILDKARARPDLVRQTLQKVQKDGLANTYNAVKNRLDQPMPLGYSSAGTIIEVGEGLVGFKAGDRVVCAGGGYAVHAEYAVVPKHLLARLPDGVSFENGAYSTLGAIALHAYRLAELQIGEHVAVIGLGLLGIIVSQIARAGGCKVIGADLSAARVEFARRFGLSAVHRDEILDLTHHQTNGQGFDAILICASTSSNDPVELAGELARDRATVVALGAVGLEIPRSIYFEKELSFIVSRSYGPGRYDPGYEEGGADYPIGYVRWTEGRNLNAFVELLATDQVDVDALTTHRFPIEGAAGAYELIKSREDSTVGVLITYPSDKEDVTHRVLLKTSLVPAKSGLRIGVLGAGNFAISVMLPILRSSKRSELGGIVAGSGMKARNAADPTQQQMSQSSSRTKVSIRWSSSPATIYMRLKSLLVYGPGSMFIVKSRLLSMSPNLKRSLRRGNNQIACSWSVLIGDLPHSLSI